MDPEESVLTVSPCPTCDGVNLSGRPCISSTRSAISLGSALIVISTLLTSLVLFLYPDFRNVFVQARLDNLCYFIDRTNGFKIAPVILGIN